MTKMTALKRILAVAHQKRDVDKLFRAGYRILVILMNKQIWVENYPNKQHICAAYLEPMKEPVESRLRLRGLSGLCAPGIGETWFCLIGLLDLFGIAPVLGATSLRF